jgi:trans-L-3-hydroxyproline dehydratase
VAFDNVPSFVYALDQEVHVPEIGEVHYDIAFGGAFYAFCSAEAVGFQLTPAEHEELIRAGRQIKQAIMAVHENTHPFEADLGFLYGVVFVGLAENERNHSRNVCVFADGEIDRSPTGTGVSARAALHYARGELRIGEPFVVESILGTTFTGKVMAETQFGPYLAVVPRVTGTAHITGRAEWLIDPDDPLAGGFFLR